MARKAKKRTDKRGKNPDARKAKKGGKGEKGEKGVKGEKGEKGVKRSMEVAGQTESLQPALVGDATDEESAESTKRPGKAAKKRVGTTASRKASVELERSAKDRPSRKSTRGSANHQKPDSQLQRRETRRTSSPKARAMRADAQRTG